MLIPSVVERVRATSSGSGAEHRRQASPQLLGQPAERAGVLGAAAAAARLTLELSAGRLDRPPRQRAVGAGVEIGVPR